MNTEEREPFIEPFTQNDGDVERAGNDAVCVAAPLDMSPSTLQMATATNNTRKGWTTVQLRIPLSMKHRITTIAAMERRQITTVVQMAVIRFINKGEWEPRPYLPPETEKCVRLSFRLPADTAARISERATAEGRFAVTLYERAILDYIEASEYDPGSPSGNGRTEPETDDPETETATGVPETEESE